MKIRIFEPTDWADVRRILAPVFQAGESYAYLPSITQEEAHEAWINVPARTYVALDVESRIVGTYYIKPNQPGLGSHVCNCGYVVDGQYSGKGIATTMCEHSQQVAVEMGFRAMQFNLVAASNERAVRLWKRLGFAEVGRLPGAFKHA